MSKRLHYLLMRYAEAKYYEDRQLLVLIRHKLTCCIYNQGV